MAATEIVRSTYLRNKHADLTFAPSPTGQGADDVGDDYMVLRTAAQLHLSELKRRVTPDTLRKQRYVLETLLAHLDGDMLINKVTTRHIESWLATQDVAPSTLRLRFGAVRNFFDYAQRRRWIRDVPTDGIILPRLPKRQPRALTPDDLVALHAALPDERAQLIIALAVNEGLRRVEIANLELGDIDIQTMTVRVITAKSHSEDLIPFTEETYEHAFVPYLRVRGTCPGKLIQSYRRPGGLTPDHLSTMVNAWMRDAGIKDCAFDGKSLHAGRHTYAMRLLDVGAEPDVIQHALRHTVLSSTWNYLRPVRTVEQLRRYMATAAGRRGEKRCVRRGD